MRRILVALIGLFSIVLSVSAQDALNLPAELYVLTNAGVVQQYGLGAAGVRTVTPEDAFVVDFGVAPDGNWVAYRTETELHVRNFYTGEDIVIESDTSGIPPVRGRGDTLAWSPQGDVLAYTMPYGARFWFNVGEQAIFADTMEGEFAQLMWSPDGRYLAAEAKDHIWWIFRRDETSMALTSAIPAGLSVVWVSPTELVFTPTDGGLVLMDLANANAQTVLLDSAQIYEQPQRLPDGRVVAFGRVPDDEEVGAGSGRLAAVGAEGQPEIMSETVVDVSAMRWTPPGELNFLIALQGGVMALVDPLSSGGFTLPITDVVAYSWGALAPPQVTGTPLPVDGFFLSRQGTELAQVWRLPADGSPAVPVTALERNVTGFALSPDGGSLAFTDGTSIRVQAPEGDDEPEEIYTAQDGGGVSDLSFSADSRRIAFVDGGVWLIAANGGDAGALLDAPPPANENVARSYALPRFAPNLDALLVNINEADGGTTGMADTNSGELFEMPDGYTNGRWLNDGRILTFGVRNPYFAGGLHVTDANTINAPAELLADTVAVQDAQELEAGNLRLLMNANVTGQAALRVVDMNLGTGALVPAADGGYLTAPLLSPDGQYIAGYRYRVLNTESGEQEGPLTIRSLADGRQVALSEPSLVWGFQWASR